MLKAVFRPGELIAISDKVVLDSPTSYSDLAHLGAVDDLVDEEDAIEEYKGPTADDLRREAENFKTNWAAEKERMLETAKAEAENIIQGARDAAFEEVKRQTDEALVIKQQAETEAERIIAEGQQRALEIENEVRQSKEAERKAAFEMGREEGRLEGFADGEAEVQRLIERTQTVLERAQDKRAEILSETEKQIVDLVLLISRKVIKVISENQRNVIINNVTEALRKVKARGDVIIKVNLVDLELATHHKDKFIKQLEGVKSIQVVEDSSVDSGGCIIQTDFGEIDARISSQLSELENRILDISPVKQAANDTAAPVPKGANVKAVLSATSSMLNLNRKKSDTVFESDEEMNFEPDSDSEDNVSQGVNAAITASAALAALATMAQKGKREADKKIRENLESLAQR